MHNKIMIVDDSTISRMIVKKTIREIFPDMIIIEAADAEEALKNFSNEDIDAVITDLHMPGMDGLELAEKIKSFKSDLPISILTANIQTEIIEKTKKLDVGYMSKPMKKDDVICFLSGLQEC